MSKKSNKPFLHMSEIERVRAWDDVGRGIHQNILKAAGCNKVITFACVVLVESDGTEKLVTYTPEYGDGDGKCQEESFIRSIRRQGLLEKGQTLKLVLRTLPAHVLIHGV